MQSTQIKPELLLPAGSIETVNAAIEGGADAIYLGLKKFNARNNAINFNEAQLVTIKDMLAKENKKLYITLNTVIKHFELRELVETLHFLEYLRPDSIIIQDLGVLYIANKYFPKLSIHASTQMAFHNSIGAQFAKKIGIERVILARELTLKELEQIQNKSNIELEFFIHGALCYSMSGNCLFSSFLGGHSANRGLCTQPCRRKFKTENGEENFFSLKDQSQVENIAKLMDMGITSLKVEGRMKSASYVYKVAKTYRGLIDGNMNKQDATTELLTDTGREKIAYFAGGDISNSITKHTNTGYFSGKILSITDDSFTFKTDLEYSKISRIRVVNKDESQVSINVKNFEADDDKITILTDTKKIRNRADVFITSYNELHFPTKLKALKYNHCQEISRKKLKNILGEFNSQSEGTKNSRKRPTLYTRINSLKWLRKIHIDDTDFLILKLSYNDLEKFNPTTPFLQKNIKKLAIELPPFIAEKSIDGYMKLINDLYKEGIKIFVISHISQIEMIPKNCRIITNENVYVFNDAASKLINDVDISSYTYPYEIDLETLDSMKNKEGILPLYYHPNLFYSRMPIVNIPNDSEFTDDDGKKFIKKVSDGMTIVTLELPVILFQNKKQLMNKGYSNFMIDLSGISPSQNKLKNIINKYQFGEQIQPSFNFNFKKGMK